MQAVKYFIYGWLTGRSFVGLKGDSAKQTQKTAWIFSLILDQTYLVSSHFLNNHIKTKKNKTEQNTTNSSRSKALVLSLLITHLYVKSHFADGVLEDFYLYNRSTVVEKDAKGNSSLISEQKIAWYSKLADFRCGIFFILI